MFKEKTRTFFVIVFLENATKFWRKKACLKNVSDYVQKFLQKMPLQTRRQITYLGNARISFRNILPWRSWCNRCCFDAQMCFEPKKMQLPRIGLGCYFGKWFMYPGLNFTYGVETLILQELQKVPNLSHYKIMVLNLHRVTENDNMILLQNEDWYLS